MNRRGERLTRQGFWLILKNYAREAHLDKTITPHTLRHTCATWLMQKGVEPWQVSGFLSMSTETLERVYGHHHPDFMKGASDAIGRRPLNVRVIR